MIRGASKSLRKVTAITENPIVKGALSFIPYGTAVAQGLKVATKVAHKADKKGAIVAAMDVVKNTNLGIPGGQEVLKRLDAIEKQKKINAMAPKAIQTQRKQVFLKTQAVVKSEIEKRRFFPGRDPVSLAPVTAMIQAQVAATSDLSDEEYEEDFDLDYEGDTNIVQYH